MRNYIRNLSKHSAIYSISTVIQRAQGLILLPILTDTTYIATRGEFGDYTLIYAFIAFMNVFYLYGIDAAFLRYYFLGKHSRQDIYRSAIQILTLTAIFSSIIIFILSKPISVLLFKDPAYEFFVKISAGILLVDTLCNLPYMILRAEERSGTYTILRIGRFTLELGLNIVFIVFMKLGVKGILYANLVAALINLIVLLPFQASYLKGNFRRDAVRDLLLFGIPMIPNGIAYLAVEMSDRYLMLYLLNKDTLGQYSANYKFGTLLLLIVTAFRTAWQPFFLKVATNPDAKKIYAKVMDIFVYMAGFAVVAGSLLLEYILTTPLIGGKSLLGSAYWGGIQIIPIILLSYMFYGIYVNLTVGIYIEKKSGLMWIFTGSAAITNIISNFYFMPAFGMMGAAFATLLAYLVMSGTIFIANQNIYPIRYHYMRLGILLIYICSVVTGFYLFHPSFLIRVLLLAGFIPLFFVTRVSKEDSSILKDAALGEKK
jgi:O-antigen/teichoic acid export membrane protein